jgi:hypothetical protein
VRDLEECTRSHHTRRCYVRFECGDRTGGGRSGPREGPPPHRSTLQYPTVPYGLRLQQWGEQPWRRVAPYNACLRSLYNARLLHYITLWHYMQH